MTTNEQRENSGLDEKTTLYKYTVPSPNDEEGTRPWDYPISLDPFMRIYLMRCVTLDQALAVGSLFAISIVQTGFIPGNARLKPTENEKVWAEEVCQKFYDSLKKTGKR